MDTMREMSVTLAVGHDGGLFPFGASRRCVRAGRSLRLVGGRRKHLLLKDGTVGVASGVFPGQVEKKGLDRRPNSFFAGVVCVAFGAEWVLLADRPRVLALHMSRGIDARRPNMTKPVRNGTMC